MIFVIIHLIFVSKEKWKDFGGKSEEFDFGVLKKLSSPPIVIINTFKRWLNPFKKAIMFITTHH